MDSLNGSGLQSRSHFTQVMADSVAQLEKDVEDAQECLAAKEAQGRLLDREYLDANGLLAVVAQNSQGKASRISALSIERIILEEELARVRGKAVEAAEKIKREKEEIRKDLEGMDRELMTQATCVSKLLTTLETKIRERGHQDAVLCVKKKKIDIVMDRINELVEGGVLRFNEEGHLVYKQ